MKILGLQLCLFEPRRKKKDKDNLRENLLLLKGVEFFFEDFTVDTVIFQILKKSIIFEPRKATTEFGHATRQEDKTHGF